MKKIFLLIAVFSFYFATAQVYFSISTDASVLRSLTPQQKFTAFGQTVKTDFHFTPKESAYASVAYYTYGKFSNGLTAVTKDTTTPLLLNYTAQSRLRYRQFSLGWKHYFRGGFANEESWNLYGTAGFGLLLGTAANTFSKAVDTAHYLILPQSVAGTGTFRRLTFDVSLGGEILLGTGVYLYGEARTWLPASDYPSPYLYNNSVPRVFLLNGGIRILLD